MITVEAGLFDDIALLGLYGYLPGSPLSPVDLDVSQQQEIGLAAEDMMSVRFHMAGLR